MTVYFLGWWNIHNGRLSRTGTDKPKTIEKYYAGGRALYGDWGRLGCVFIDENENIIIQFNKENPLKYKDNGFYYHKNFNILKTIENPHLFISKRKDMLFTFNYFRRNVEKSITRIKRKYKRNMENFIELIHTDNTSLTTLRKNSDFLPSFINYMVDLRPELLMEENAEIATKLTSPMYCGGCIKTFVLHNVDYIVYCDGDKLSKLTINKFNTSKNSLENTSIQNYDVSEDNKPIFQIDAISYDSFVYISVRCEYCIVLFNVLKSGNDIDIVRKSSTNSMEQFVSCKFNSTTKTEIAATFEDYLNIYNTERMEIVWNKDITCYSSVMDKWNEVQTSSSRHWLVTNRSTSYCYDYRINPFKSGLELFSTPIDCLSRQEAIYHATNVFNDYNFYIFTTFNAVLLDIRSPMSVVSQWTMPTVSPASYSTVCPLNDTDKLNFTVGCQLDAKHVLFQQYRNTNSKSTCLSSSSDWGSDSVMSLGLASHINDATGLVTVFTLDHNANVLGNQYERNSDVFDYHSLSEPADYVVPSTKRFKTNPENFHSFEEMEFDMEPPSNISIEPYGVSEYKLIENLLQVKKTDLED